MVEIASRRYGRINHDVGPNQLRIAVAEVHPGWAAASVRDRHRVGEAFVPSQGGDVRGVLRRGVSSSRSGGLAHAPSIHAENTMGVLEVADLLFPVRQIRTPAVNEDQGRVSPFLALYCVVQLGPIFGPEWRHHVLLATTVSYHSADFCPSRTGNVAEAAHRLLSLSNSEFCASRTLCGGRKNQCPSWQKP